MTFCSTYIGDLDDPKFHWEGGDWNGNIPKALSPDFPPTSRHYNHEFHSWVAKAGVDSKQTDFDGHVAIVTKAQIVQFLDFCYELDASHSNSKVLLPGHAEKLEEVLRFVATLSEDRKYALVAECF